MKFLLFLPPSNRNETPPLLEALPKLSRTVREVGLDLHGTVMLLFKLRKLEKLIRFQKNSLASSKK